MKCHRPAVDGAPFPVCVKHIAELQEFVRARIQSPDRPDMQLNRQRQAAKYLSNEGVVYYVRVGELIKIGTTKQPLENRLGVLPPDRQVLATEPGGFPLERQRHLQFRHLRAKIGEWFHPAPELWSHIAKLRTEHGEPAELRSRVAT